MQLKSELRIVSAIKSLGGSTKKYEAQAEKRLRNNLNTNFECTVTRRRCNTGRENEMFHCRESVCEHLKY